MTRRQAQREYDAALKAMLIAASGDDEAVYIEAVAALEITRAVLLQAEQQFPTRQEAKRAAALLRRANRGLDIF